MTYGYVGKAYSLYSDQGVKVGMIYAAVSLLIQKLSLGHVQAYNHHSIACIIFLRNRTSRIPIASYGM